MAGEVTPPRVILASQSPRRRELLAQIGIAHEVRPADIDEAYLPHELPAPHAERLAREKAGKLAAEHPDALVIGADTIVVIDRQVLGKPADAADAERMLMLLGGRTHMVHTAVAVACGARVVSGVESVEVTFRPLTPEQAHDYVATGEPMDKAGAYGIQGYGSVLVERIRGDYFAVMGLALGRLVELLRDVGVVYRFRGLEDAR
ncbi:MAG: septum formation protein Maf [Gemmatimonadetes bacterium SCN 70-22]|nr:MAG: septum formation protein Maf [Gemmatimonadetes bacterium SCN 70-22]